MPAAAGPYRPIAPRTRGCSCGCEGREIDRRNLSRRGIADAPVVSLWSTASHTACFFPSRPSTQVIDIPKPPMIRHAGFSAALVDDDPAFPAIGAVSAESRRCEAPRARRAKRELQKLCAQSAFQTALARQSCSRARFVAVTRDAVENAWTTGRRQRDRSAVESRSGAQPNRLGCSRGATAGIKE